MSSKVARSVSEDITIGEVSCSIMPRLVKDQSFPRWPPDCYAICASLLGRSGGYSRLFQNWPPYSSKTLGGWVKSIRGLSNRWRESWDESPQADFTELTEHWQVIVAAFASPISELALDRQLCESLMIMLASADEACEGVGTPDLDPQLGFMLLASRNLEKNNTLCSDAIHPSRLKVLPKMHTPQNGLTERSLSLYISLFASAEVVPRWIRTPFIQGDSMNLLLLPWPYESLARQFRDVTERAPKHLPKSFGFFSYEVSTSEDQSLADSCAKLLIEARRKLGRIDGIILPELAATDEQLADVRSKLPDDCFLISGLGESGGSNSRGRNAVRFSFPSVRVPDQKKHHPWKLDESQIIQYGIGGVLDPFREWWEYTDVSDRHLNFLAMSEDLVLCALVCEDLARPDPVASLVRSVGPSLLIALLMDGPQIKERWAARFATVFADDPGCSVLSMTSLGMSELSHPRGGPSRSRVVAMWKDSFSGISEIEMPIGCDAVAISLSMRYREEYTADGRGDGGGAAFPTLSGVHPIKLGSARK